MERLAPPLVESLRLRSLSGMGSKRLDKISDYHRHGSNLRVVCGKCGRAGVLDRLKISQTCRRAGQSRDMGAISRRLWCSDCGSRDVKCGPVERLPGERDQAKQNPNLRFLRPSIWLCAHFPMRSVAGLVSCRL